MKFLTTIILLFLFVFTIKAQSSFFVDDAENVYKCGPDWVKKYAPEDTVGLIVAGGNGLGGNANQLNNPRAVIVDEKGDIFICDTENHRIQKWEKGAKTGITVAGGNGAGSAMNQLNNPSSFVFDSKGKLIIQDNGNSRYLNWKLEEKEGSEIFNAKISYPNKILYLNSFVLQNDNTILISTFSFDWDWRGKILAWNIKEQIGSDYAPTNETKEYFNNFFPGELYLDKYKNLFVKSWEVWNVLKIAPNSTKPKTIVPYQYGISISLDKKGNLWLFDSVKDIVYKYEEKPKEPILGQFLNAETIIDGNAPSINNQFQISLGSKFTQDKKGNIYVLETAKDRVLKANADGKTYTVVAGGNGKGNLPNQLDNPRDILVDDSENIYIADAYNYRIQKFEKGNLNGITVAGGNGYGNSPNQLTFPEMIKFNSTGELIILDGNNHRVLKWPINSKEGEIIAGGNGDGINLNQLNNPRSIFLDSNDNLYIGDGFNNRIVKWEKGAKTGFEIVKSAGYIKSLITDIIGNIYYVDGNTIKKWHKSSNNISHIVTEENDLVGLISPEISSIFANATLVITDPVKLRLLKLQINGSTNAIDEKDLEIIFQANGLNSDINQLNSPTEIFYSKLGEIIVKDFGNLRIQKLSQNSSLKENLISSVTANQTWVDDESNIYLLETGAHRIRKWNNSTKQYSVVAGGKGRGDSPNQLNNPSCFWVSDNGDIFVGDHYNYRIQKWSKGANLGITLSSKNDGGIPAEIFVDTDSTIYIINYSNETFNLEKREKNSKNWNKIANGRIYSSDSDLNYTSAIFVDKSKNVYALDSDKILKWKTNSTIPEYVFGNGINQKFDYPQGFTIAPNGDIYIADTGNNRILKVNPNVKIAEKSVSQKTLTEYNGAYFLTQTNELIAKIIPNESNLAMRKITASVAVDAVQDQSFVKRHYKIEMNNPAHKAKISLYFTQAEFDAYNLLNEKKLPASPTDKTGIANIIITSAKVNSGRRALPLQTTIDIPEIQIVWNENLNVWEVSFEDTGSKEYWLKTKFEYKKSSNPRPPRPFENTKYARLAIENEEINEFTSQIEVYPNPASKIFTLKINDSALLGTKASLQNEIGKVFKTFTLSKNMEEISIENLPTGIYFIQLVNGKVAKVVKN